jgi:hypothetical protein
MPIDLPPDSLGPVPTKTQMELLRKMAAPGIIVHTWTGVRMDSGGAYISLPDTSNHETVNSGTVSKFYDWGWLEHLNGDFRGHNYRVSERGMKVIEKGKTR